MSSEHFDIEKLIRRGSNAIFSAEYSCKLRRLFPWPGVVETKRPVTEFGCIWVVVDPSCTVDTHEHDEEEAFIVVSGRARMTVSGQQTELGAGDVAYIPRLARHQIANPSEVEPFVMIDLYWDNREPQNSGTR
jgi:mannose-6-phosphate isomerase-like protein (cupin superfamily)